MKKDFQSFLFMTMLTIIVSCMFVGCKSADETKSIEARDKTFVGFDGQPATGQKIVAVSSPAELSYKGNTLSIKVTFKIDRNSPDLKILQEADDAKAIKEGKDMSDLQKMALVHSFFVALKNDSDKFINKVALTMSSDDAVAFEKFVVNGKDDTMDITFQGNIDFMDMNIEEIFNQAVKFNVIAGDFDEADKLNLDGKKLEDTSFDSDSTDTSLTDDEGSADIDDLLNSYEEYVDQTIETFKKVSDGDTEAMSEYQSLLEKAQDLSNQLANTKGNFSAEQLNRFNEINKKMLDVSNESINNE